MENEKRVLRWGGLAGILAVIAFIVDMPYTDLPIQLLLRLVAPKG